MTPDLQNILVSLLSVVYVFAVVAIMDRAVRSGLPQDISRKIVHICAGSWLIFWYFFDPDVTSRYFNILPAVIWFILLLLKGFFAKPDDEAVKTMTRYGDKRELLKGPLYFTLIMMSMGLFYFNTEKAIYAMGFLGWGDGMAPIIGTRFGKNKYRFFTEKSLEGSLSFFIAGSIGTLFFSWFLLGHFDLTKILLIGAGLTIIEALSPKDLDNIIIPIFAILLLSII
ncbi:MAG: SEC59/DGK1/VTE5 family protein [Ignavibacteriales bacterium]|nr:SEC59/DGK1/VTE5 family protein [Ignavibacteriales bacterium]